MPLHLLGKKSWNVYNPANVARVQRDEAEAQKREQEEERRQRQDEASDRIAVLRGERDGTQQESRPAISSRRDHEDYDDQESSRRRTSKKRKLPGEDDTDRDIRLAQAQAEAKTPSSLSKGHTSSKVEKSQDHSITDSDGHISLIPIPAQTDRPQNKKQKPDENPSHFYLSEAAGYGSKAGDTPWYSSASKDPSSMGPKESWGSTSPRRKEREVARVSANDPLAMMKRGVKQLRESERLRKEWKEQRERDLREVEDLARQQGRKKRHRDRDSEKLSHKHRRRDDLRRRSNAGEADDDLNSLDGFNLDEGYTKPPEKDNHRDKHNHRRHHHHSHQHRRRRSRSRSRSRSPRRE
jgi:hypothetical protein